MDVVERQLVVIRKDLNGVSQFSIPLNLEFTPDFVIVREVILSDNGHGGGNGTHVITTPWIRSNEHILLAFDDTSNYHSNPDTHFLIKNSATILNGDATFTVREATDVLSASTATGRIAITLEFGLYEKRRSIDEIIISSTTKMVEAMVKRGCVYPFCVPNQDGNGAIPSGEIDPSTGMPKVHRDLTPSESEPVLEGGFDSKMREILEEEKKRRVVALINSYREALRHETNPTQRMIIQARIDRLSRRNNIPPPVPEESPPPLSEEDEEIPPPPEEEIPPIPEENN